MKRLAVSALSILSFVGTAGAQTALSPGMWEITDKTTLEGVQPPPPTSRELCIKGKEATLERLLYPSPEDFAKHGCTFSPISNQNGLFKAKSVCPSSDQLPEVTAEVEIRYKPDGYEGIGQLLLRDNKGATVKGNSILTGKRTGDC